MRQPMTPQRTRRAARPHRLAPTARPWAIALVALALVAAACAWRGFRPLGAVLLPLAALLSLATVYCQFHYAVDALAGAGLAAAALIAGRRAGYDASFAEPDHRAATHGETR